MSMQLVLPLNCQVHVTEEQKHIVLVKEGDSYQLSCFYARFFT